MKYLTNAILLLLLFPAALAATEISILPEQVDKTFNETFVVSVNLDSDDDVFGLQFDLSYNPLVLEATSTAEGSYLTSDGASIITAQNEINNSVGKVSYAASRFLTLNGTQGNASVLNATFKTIAKNGVSSLNLEGVKVRDPAPSNIDTEIKNSSVTVKTIEPVIINEIMANPSKVDDAEGEYIELYNPNDFDVNISGWTLKDNGSDSHKIGNNSLTVPSKALTVLCRNKNSSENGNFSCDYEYSGFTLGNSDDEVILSNEGNFEVDKVLYNSSFPLVSGASMELIDTSLDNSIASNWREATIPYGDGDRGTPGAVNAFVSGPEIENLPLMPETVFNDNDVLLKANITDILEITNVTIRSNFTGAGQDYEVTEKNNTLYSFKINKENLSNQEVVSYVWVAEDVGNFMGTGDIETFKVQNRDPVSATIPQISMDEDTQKIIDLNLYFSDPDNDPLAFSSTTPEDVQVLINNTTGNATLIPDENFEGSDNVVFTANDPFNGSNSSNNVTIAVSSQNDAPTFDSLPGNFTIDEDNKLTFQILASDVDGDSLTYSVDNPLFDINSTGFMTFTPLKDFNGMANATVNVSDGVATTSKSIKVTVNPVNDAPVINISEEARRKQAFEETDKTIDVKQYISDADDPIEELTITHDSPYGVVNGTNITFNFPNNVLFHNTTITVSDGQKNDSEVIFFNITNANDAPTLSPIPDQTIVEGMFLTFQLKAEDTDPTNDTLTFSTNASFGTLNASSGLFEFTPDSNDIGSHAVNFAVSDGNNGSDGRNASIKVEPALKIVDLDIEADGKVFNDLEENDIIDAKPNELIKVKATLKNKFNESLFGINVNATIDSTLTLLDSDSIPVLDANEEHLFELESKLPSIITSSLFDLKVSASGVDESLNERMDIVSLKVNVAKDKHNVLIDSLKFSPDNISCTRNTTLEVTLTNAGQFDEEVMLEASSPELNLDTRFNESINANTQKTISVPISAPNTPKGSFPIEVKATYFFVKTATEGISLNIKNCAPTLSPIPDQEVTEKSQLAFTLTGSDFDAGDVLSFSSENENISFSKINDTAAEASWIPANSDIGINNIKFNATDGIASDTKTATINVLNINDAPVIESFSPLNDPKIAEDTGIKQEFSVAATDDDNDPLTIQWFLDGSNVASGSSFTFTSDGTTGTFEVLVNVSDGNLSAIKEWTLTVSDVPITNLFELEFDGPLSNARNVTISSINGKIEFKSPIDLSKTVDLNSFVLLQQGAAGVDTSNLPDLNGQAKITLFNLPFDETPLLFRNLGFKVEGDDLCPSNVCTSISYSSGTLMFDVTGFSVYFVPVANNNPVITSSPITTAFINETYRYGVDATDADNDPLAFSLTTFPAGMTISSAGLIEWNPMNFTTEQVSVKVTDGKGGSDSQSYTLTVKEEPKLKISDLDVKVGGKSDKNVNNEDRIRHEAEPGDTLEFDLEIESLFTDEDDIEIEDIDVEITIVDIDDGDDLEEDSDEFDLRPEKDEDVKIRFVVPLEVDEDIFDVEIHIEGDDERGNLHEIDWLLELEVEKKNHEVRISSAAVTPSLVSCERTSTINAAIINTGSQDEDGVTLEISSPTLGISHVREGIELDEGTSNNRFDDSLRFTVGEDILKGTYPITINTFYDGNLDHTETLQLTVQDCVQVREVVEEVKEKPEVAVIRPPVTAQPRPAPPTEISFVESGGYIVLLIILTIILIGTIIFVFGAAIIALRR